MKIIIGKERIMENDDIFYNLFNSYNRKFQLWYVAMETTQYRWRVSKHDQPWVTSSAGLTIELRCA